jgi:signal transduction histidine kinase
MLKYIYVFKCVVMSKYSADAFKLIRSRIGRRIGLLVFIQIFFIITSLAILSYYQSQVTYLGNSINIAGKNRFLTSNLMFSTAEYFIENRNDISKIDTAINELEANMLILKHGGKVSGIVLKPLPSEFSNDWDNTYQKWFLFKTILTNNILKENQIISPVVEVTSETASTVSSSSTTLSNIEIDKIIKSVLETGALPLVNSSDVLVTKLGEYGKNNSQYSIFLEILFAVLNIGVTTAFVIYLSKKILKPIFALTNATSALTKGNLDVYVKTTGNDELSRLSQSFNLMVNSIKNFITKQNELTKKLEKANEELRHKYLIKEEFINVASHELRTPIQSILGLSELLQFRTLKNITNIQDINIQKYEEIVDVIIRNCRRILQLTNDILDVAKIERGSLILNTEKFDLQELIVEILREYEHTIKNRNNVKFFFESPDSNHNTIEIEADKGRLSQVLHNLLSNAIKFTKEGQITVIVKRNENEIIVSIKDNGPGIDQEIFPKLFSKFTTYSLGSSGTGLGLFISKSIIEKHGGKIWGTNDTINGETRGSTFSFSLPI